MGSVFRYLMSLLVNKYFAAVFPLATFTVNLLGCFLIGMLIGLLDKHQLGNGFKWFLITGFCGGFTTFSAFGVENYNLLTSQNTPTALVYIGASVLGGILAVWGGLSVTMNY